MASKPLPRQTARALNPPANVTEPYEFFESARVHPFQPLDTTLNLRNAWWLADAALLGYSSDTAVQAAFQSAGISGAVRFFAGKPGTQAYAMSMADAVVLAFRGTQVDDFWSSLIDFTTDVQFLPVPDSHGDLVHAGFLLALHEVWEPLITHLRGEQEQSPRPFWITGHSLGGALATVAANLCCDDPSLRLHGVYTYGSPRVGDSGFGSRIRVPVFRFRNDADLVPHLPPGPPFRHVGRLQFIDGGGHLHSDVTPAAELMMDVGAGLVSATDAVTLQTVTRTETAFDLPLPAFLADHAPLNYSVLVWNCYDVLQR
jgi:hypothetical protein